MPFRIERWQTCVERSCNEPNLFKITLNLWLQTNGLGKTPKRSKKAATCLRLLRSQWSSDLYDLYDLHFLSLVWLNRISWWPNEFVPSMASCDWKCFRRRSSSKGAQCSKYSQFLDETRVFSKPPDKANLLRLHEVTKSFVIHRDTWGKHRQAAKCAHKTLCPVLPCCLTNKSPARSISTCQHVQTCSIMFDIIDDSSNIISHVLVFYSFFSDKNIRFLRHPSFFFLTALEYSAVLQSIPRSLRGRMFSSLRDKQRKQDSVILSHSRGPIRCAWENSSNIRMH